MSKFCSNCGNGIPNNIKFCPECGAQIQGAPTNEQPSTVQTTDVQQQEQPSWYIPPLQQSEKPQIESGASKKRSTLEWIGIFFVGAILIVVALIVLSIMFITPSYTETRQTTSTYVQNVITPLYNQDTATVVTTTHYIDPYPNALPLNSAYHIENTLDDLRYPPLPYSYDQPSPTHNDVSIQIIRASLWDSYTFQKPTNYQTVGPFAEKKFVIIVVEVTNYIGNDVIISPYPSNFELIYAGSNYSPTKLEYPIQAAGNSYKSEKIARLEKTGGVLVYEVPSSSTLNRSYVQLIISDDNEKNPIWRLY